MKAEVRNQKDLEVSFTNPLAPNGKPIQMKEVIIAAVPENKSVWYDSYGACLPGNSTVRQTVYGHLTAEDARIIGETLIRAADIAEGKV